MKMRKGNRPDGPGWLFKTILVGVSKWTVCYKVATAGVSWTEVKLVAETPAPYKGNFYVKWNGERFAKSRDSGILFEQHRGLHDAAVKLLTGISAGIFPAGAEERAALPLNERAEAFLKKVAEEHPEVYAKVISGLKPNGGPRSIWTNLGPVGVVVGLERDLLVKDISKNRVEARLSTSTPDELTDSYFFCEEIEGGLESSGVLYNALKRINPEVWPKVEELLEQYFLEKDFY